MKKTVRNLICLLLLFSLTAALFVSCGDSSKPDSTTASADTVVSPSETTLEVETTHDPRYDDKGYLKDEIGDFNYGKSLTLLFWSDANFNEFTSEGTSGEAVSDALYARNQKVEERAGITFEYLKTPGNSSNIASFYNKLQAMVTAGDKLDMVGTYSMTAGYSAVRGMYVNIADSEYLEWDKPWWPDSLMSQVTINNKLYFASGDISTNALYMMYVTFFNKTILQDRKLENPYELVKQNKWTFEKMWEMSKGIYTDVNANGIHDAGDLYGNYFYQIHLDAYVIAAGITFMNNNNGEVQLNDDFTGDRGIEVVGKLVDFTKDTTAAFMLPKYGDISAKETVMYFAEGCSLFWTDRCYAAATIQEGTAIYGIVPVAKADENQDKFYTALSNPFTLYGLPSTTTDIEFACSVMELMASESYRQVSPVLYDTVIKYRFADDAESAALFDGIRDNVVFDLGRIFANNFGVPYTVFEKSVLAGTSWKTVVDGQLKIWKNNLKTLLKAFE